jgi:hypothetical protein
LSFEFYEVRALDIQKYIALISGDPPDFPLLPASRGFCISLAKAMAAFDEALVATGTVTKSVL